MSTTEVIAEVVVLKELIIRLSEETERSSTGPQDALTREAAKAVRMKFMAAVASLEESANELTRMLGAQVNKALASVRSPADCVKLVRALKGAEIAPEREAEAESDVATEGTALEGREDSPEYLAQE